MTTPRPIFAKMVKPDNQRRSTRLAANHYHFQGAYYTTDPVYPPVRTPVRDDDYEKEAACSTCHQIDCICAELDSEDYKRRYQGP